MRYVPLIDAEKTEYGYTTITVPAGTKVSLGRGIIATVTQAAIDCDCGKGIFCPLNPQERMETTHG